MTWQLWFSIGAVVGLAVVLIGNRIDNFFDDHDDFGEFMITTIERIITWAIAAAAWPVALLVGGLYTYYAYSQGNLRKKVDNDF